MTRLTLFTLALALPLAACGSETEPVDDTDVTVVPADDPMMDDPNSFFLDINDT